MREILFKAKRVDNGEWVEGELVTNKPTDSYRIITNFGLCIDGKYAGNNLHHITGEIHLVEPETVCQYTGLKDKNGNKMFEGDIVRINDKNKFNKVKRLKYRVEFTEGAFMAILTDSEYPNVYPKSLRGCKNVTTHGNIHD